MAGIVLHQNGVVDCELGERRLWVIALSAYLNALHNRGVHIVALNDFLARKNARQVAPIFNRLGMSNVGVLQMAAVTENGTKAFLVDFEKELPNEDQHHLRLVDRVEAYNADITYGTNSEFCFDYLRNNMKMSLKDRVQRGHYYAIVDEVDYVLIDEARTPLTISGPSQGDLEWYGKMAQVVKQLKPEDYEVNEKDRAVNLTEVGTAHAEQLIGQPLMDPDRPEDVTPEQASLTGFLEQAMRAQYIFHRNEDYLVQNGKVIILDELTGPMPSRRWSDGLHQAVEAKENVRIENENKTYATITIQNYYHLYQKLAGLGEALEPIEREEFKEVYGLYVVFIPSSIDYRAIGPNSDLVLLNAHDEENYQYSYFARKDDGHEPVYYRRKDYPDAIYRTIN